jgi:hypothetical protein
MRKQLLPLALVGGFLLLAGVGTAIGWNYAGGGGAADRPSSPAAAAAASPSPSPSKKDDFLALSACQEADNWRTAGRPVDYEKIQEIADSARNSSTPDIRIRGQLLHDSLAIAKASIGKTGHAGYEAKALEALAELDARCVAAGLGYRRG